MIDRSGIKPTIRPTLTRKQAECLVVCADLFLCSMSQSEACDHLGTPERVAAAWEAMRKVRRALGNYEYREEPEFGQD